jgi:FkbM family methyltransferase
MANDPQRLPALPRVSYAQNMEDILLDRLFGNEVGTFMDVGACYPTGHNNTYFFYLRGWRGTTVEPIPWMRPLFEQHRPEDRHLSLAAWHRDGDVPFYEIPGNIGLSTFSPEIAEGYRERGLEVVERRLPVRTVASIVDEFAIEPPDILSIDTEGTEEHVLRGVPFERWRPRVLLVEATYPQSTTPSHGPWEPLVLSQGYLFAAFNGVNRFYLREDQVHLLEHFATPVSALDDYVGFELFEMRQRLEQTRSQLDELYAAHELMSADHHREKSALEEALGSLRAEVLNWQRKLRPYRLLDPMGAIPAGHRLARRIKGKRAS